ncbi:MAG: TIGR04563 family protein [Myxococcales bacterium]|nr:TIGR04563 family protein [Myxococcales bacterium]USN51206.1 MAG: TIGR04563 family protein [Myxococcales bacterium]
MTTTDKRKRSLYFPDTILREMQSEAKRQERSLSWIVQYAWRIARAELMRLPSVGESGYQNESQDDEPQSLSPTHASHSGPESFEDPSHFSQHGG